MEGYETIVVLGDSERPACLSGLSWLDDRSVLGTISYQWTMPFLSDQIVCEKLGTGALIDVLEVADCFCSGLQFNGPCVRSTPRCGPWPSADGIISSLSLMVI